VSVCPGEKFMGSSPYWYFVDYEDDFNSTLQKLRERDFKAGRYNPVIPMPEFPIKIMKKSLRLIGEREFVYLFIRMILL
jgi:hypothetical protein